MGEAGRCVRRSLRVASALGTIWQVGLTQNSLDPLTIFFDPNCEDPLVWLRSCCGARNDAPRRSGAHGRTRAQRDASHLSVLAQKISGGAGTPMVKQNDARAPTRRRSNIRRTRKKWILSSLSQHTAAAAASARRARRTSRLPCRTWYLAMTVPRRRLLYAARRKHASFWSSSSPTASSTDTELSSTCATTCGVVRGGV